MKIPVTKSDIKGILISNPNTFFTTKEVAAALELTGDAAVDRVSTLLYRLRHDSNIERVRSNSSYKYRYVKPTKDKGLVEKPTKERDNNDALASFKQGRYNELDKYCYIEQLEEVEFGYCDRCESDEIYWRAEVVNGGIEFLCNKCGELVEEYLEANGGVIDSRIFDRTQI